MSGLAVLYHRDGRPADPGLVSRMLDAAIYRGPDGTQVRVLGRVGLGHARMVVHREDVYDRQPLISSRSGCAIVADVRLDNRHEVIARLPFSVPSTATDAELILCGYDAWGARVAGFLLGDFAFVIWDPARQRMVCARDTSGQRSLFYRLDGTFAAASEIHQLFQDPMVPIAPNEEHIADYLVELQIGRNEKDSAATFYRGINAVPAGHVLEVDSAHAHLSKYWDVDSSHEIHYRNDAEYEAHFQFLVFQAVKDRLRSAKPVGALLSGGLDSSTIVGVAQALLARGDVPRVPLTGFSALYGALDCDESELIEDVQRTCGVDVEYVFARTDQGGSRLRLDSNGFSPAPSVWSTPERDALLGAASRNGVRALLTGEVADNCLSGVRMVFDSLLRRGLWSRLVHDLAAYRRVSNESLHTIVALYCLMPLLPLGMQGRVASWRLRRSFSHLRHQLLPTWLDNDKREEVLRTLFQRLDHEVRDRRFASPAREAEYRLLYPPEVGRSFGPWSLEFRRPFADRRLHEFLLAIPPDQKFRPHPSTDDFYAGSKWLLRRATRGLLPESVRTRTVKTAFNAAFERELDESWRTYAAAFGPEAEPRIAARGYVDQSRFWARLQSLRAGTSGSDFVYLLRMVELETWLRGLEQPRSRLSYVVQPLARARELAPNLP